MKKILIIILSALFMLFSSTSITAKAEENFIFPTVDETGQIQYDNGINVYGSRETVRNGPTTSVLVFNFIDLPSQDLTIYLIMSYDTEYASVNRAFFPPDKYLRAYQINTMYYFTVNGSEISNTPLGVIFNSPDPFTVEYNIVVVPVNESTPQYFLGYNQGYGYGEINGYQKFKEDNAYGPFVGAKVDITFTRYNEDPIILTDQTPVLNYNYLTFPTAWNDLSDISESVDLSITLENPILYNNYTLSRFGDDANIMGSYFIDDEGLQYTTTTETTIGQSQNIFAFQIIDPPPKAVNIKKIVLHYGRPSDTFPRSGITISEGGYLVGYNTGVNDGIEEGKQIGIEEGKQIGIEEGKQIGYQQAVADGLSAKGIFNSTIAVITTVFMCFGQFLGTKIAGDLTIGLFVIGVPATFMIIDLIIKLVRALLSMGGASSE